jgi:hypothetical protein
MKPTLPLLFASALLFLPLHAQASLDEYDLWAEDYTVQALVGATHYNHLKFRIDDSDSPRKANLCTLPQLGATWSTPPIGDRFQLGLETSFLLGFQVDKLNYLYAGGGGLKVDLSVSLWTFDLAGGAYASCYLGAERNIRLYAGGGPLLLYIDYRTEREYSDGSENENFAESAFGTGAYARGGIEFRIRKAAMVGLGVRSTWANIDLSNAGGSADLAGTALFATFTAGF